MTGNQTEQYQEYLKDLIGRLQDGKQDVEGAELTLGKMYLDSQIKLQQVIQERENATKQLNSMQQRLQQLNAAVQEEVGRSGGLAESLVALKFGGGQDEKVAPVNRKGRRAAASKSKKEKTDG